MKRQFQMFVWFVSGFFLTQLSFANDGTLPFGDGTLPFGMSGKMSEVRNGQTIGQYRLSLEFNQPRSSDRWTNLLNDQSTTTRSSFERVALSSAPCAPSMKWYPVGGVIKLVIGGRPATYQVNGVCARGTGLGQREVFATNQRETLRLRGQLGNLGSSRSQLFKGEATQIIRGQPLKTYFFELAE